MDHDECAKFTQKTSLPLAGLLPKYKYAAPHCARETCQRCIVAEYDWQARDSSHEPFLIEIDCARVPARVLPAVCVARDCA